MPGTTGSRLIVAALAALLGVLACPGLAAAQDPCEDPRNLTFNCQFDSFTAAPGGEVPTGWWPFVVSGHPAFDPATDTPKQPSLRVWSDGEGFVAGVYQEVRGVQVGATYEAFIGWAVFQSAGSEMGRAIGIDPTGGTDATSASVVWSTEVWEKKRSNPELRVRAVAQADKITVFVRANNPRSSGADQAFLDAVSLVRDESVPLEAPAIAPEPTDTPAPEATATPPEPAPEPTPTPTPADTVVEPAPTDSPTPPAPPTAMPAPTDTPVPTATSAPGPTDTPLPPTATATRRSAEVWVLATAPVELATVPVPGSFTVVEQSALAIEGPAVLLAGVVAAGGVAIGLRRTRRRSGGAR